MRRVTMAMGDELVGRATSDMFAPSSSAVHRRRRRCPVISSTLPYPRLASWHQAWHLPSLTFNDQLMLGCIASDSRAG